MKRWDALADRLSGGMLPKDSRAGRSTQYGMTSQTREIGAFLVVEYVWRENPLRWMSHFRKSLLNQWSRGVEQWPPQNEEEVMNDLLSSPGKRPWPWPQQ